MVDNLLEKYKLISKFDDVDEYDKFSKDLKKIDKYIMKLEDYILDIQRDSKDIVDLISKEHNG